MVHAYTYLKIPLWYQTQKAHRHATPSTDVVQIFPFSPITWVLSLDKWTVLTIGNAWSTLSASWMLCLGCHRCSYQCSHEGAPRVHSASVYLPLSRTDQFLCIHKPVPPFSRSLHRALWAQPWFFPVSPALIFIFFLELTTGTRPPPVEQCTLPNWIYQVLINT